MKPATKLPREVLASLSKLKIRQCARCGKDHPVEARMFTGEPIKGYNAWAPCPTTGDPILVAVTDADEPPPPPKEPKPMATPRPTSRLPDEEELIAKFHRQKIAEAADFLENAGEVSNEVASGLIQISEQARGILRGPLTEQALLILLQPKCQKRRNGDPMPFGEILSVLRALATLDEYLIAAKGGR